MIKMPEENPKKEAKNAAISTTTPQKKEKLQKGITCLHISRTSLSTQALADLTEIGIKVTKCSDIQQAKSICKNEVFGMILLEEKDENQDFITNLKVKGAPNEQTPVIYIAQGPLSEDVKNLVKDQYVDDILFRCSSMDSDLIKAVKRLIAEPLQFAVTPKSKKGESSTPKRQKLENKIPISARRCIANNFPTTDTNAEWSVTFNMHGNQENGSMFINLDSSTAAHQAAVFDPSLTPSVSVITHTNDQRWISSQNPQYNHQYISAVCTPEYRHSPQTASNMQLLTAAAEMSQALTSIQEEKQQNPSSEKSAITLAGHNESADQFNKLRDFYPTTQGNAAESVQPITPQTNPVNPADVNQMQIALQNAERAINSSLPEMLADELVPKITLTGARQLLDSALLGIRPQSLPKKVQKEHESEESRKRESRKSSEGLGKMSHEECDEKKDGGKPKRPRVIPLVISLFNGKTREDPLNGYTSNKESYSEEYDTWSEMEKNIASKPKRSKRGRRSGTFNEEKQWTPNTLEERKELHLAKERKRRERIARCWHQLRRMIPMCDTNADKATVFEMTVAYLHHCWKHHAVIIQKINRDFETFCGQNGPPEDLDEIDDLVTKLLDMEN